MPHDHDDHTMPRREFLQIASTALAFGSTLLAVPHAVLAEGDGSGTGPGSGAGNGEGKKEKGKAVGASSANGALRIGCVSTAVEGGLMPSLVDSYRKAGGGEVKLIKDDGLYGPAMDGKYDLLISHFGHHDAEKFIQGGFGMWPRMVFSNQLCLAGPTSDPAGVRGMNDLVGAFKKIAEAKAPYVLNQTRPLTYLTEILWEAAGRPAKGEWFIRSGRMKRGAFEVAAEKNAYVIWGLTPFLREKKASHGALVPLVTADPLLQRVMVSVVVNPEKIRGVNRNAALAFQEFLLQPATQAKILKTHYTGAEQAIWAPAGRQNAGYLLPG